MEEDIHYKWKLPISFYLTLFTFVFSISGYIYARTYYREFGVKVERFFALEDYLRNSIDRIYTLVLALGIWAVIIFFVIKIFRYKVTKNIKNSDEEKEMRKRKVIKYINWFLFVVICASMVFLYIRGPAERFVVYMSTIGGICGYLYKLAEDRGFWGFKDVEWIILTGLTYFIIVVFLVAGRDAHLIKSGKKYMENIKYEFMVNEEKDLKHIGSTSLFMFMYNEKENYTVIIPTSKLEHVKVFRK